MFPYWFRGGDLLDEGHAVLNWFAEGDTARYLTSNRAYLAGDTACEKWGHEGQSSINPCVPIKRSKNCVG